MSALIGKLGEELAREYLQNKHYEILVQNFRTRYGEVDIIARKEGRIIFVEVKTRTGTRFGQPYEAVQPHKVRKIQSTAIEYLRRNNLGNSPLQIDVISLELNSDNSIKSIRHIENVGF